MATSKKPGKKLSVNVDFSDTEASGLIPEGDHSLEVTDVKLKTSDNSGADYLSFTFAVEDGEYKGKKVWHNCSLQPQALFNLRALLEALGYEVPQGPMDLDPADLIGNTCLAAIVHEKYEGKTQARVAEFLKAEEEAEETPEPVKETPEPVKEVKKGPKAKPEPEPEPEAPKSKKKVKKAAVLEVGADVTFDDDDGNTLVGKVTAMEDGNVTVLCGEDEWELESDDVTVV